MIDDQNLRESDGLELITVLGQGAMGVVYKARDMRANQVEVAVKTMNAMLANIDGFRERFVHEANSIARLRHDNIVAIRRFSERTAPKLYLVMDYIEGGNLRQYLEDMDKRQGRLDLFEALQVALQIAQALGHAHDQGYVHRDVKPENILLKARPQPGAVGLGTHTSIHALLTDFGLAVLMDEVPFAVTQGPVGTFAYSSPEQLRSESRLDGRADIYSLGVVLYELITGKRPFDPQSMAEALKMHESDEVIRPSMHRRGLPSALDAVILRCLAKQPDQRYRRAAELAQALHDVYNALYSGTIPMPPEVNAQAERITQYLRYHKTPTAPLLNQPRIPGPAPIAPPMLDAEVDNRAQGHQITVAEEFLDQVDVSLTPPSVRITPGQQAQLRVEITNRSVIEERFRLDIRGVPRIDREATPSEKQWASITPATLELVPGQSGEARLTFAPPRHPSSVAGPHIYTLRVYSLLQHYEVALKQCEVNLTPFQEITVELRPERLYNTHDATLTIANNGNVRANCQIRVRDSDMGMGLMFQFDDAEVSVAPGKRVELPFTVRPTQRAYVHGARPIRFEIAVTAGEQTEIVAGEMIVMADLLGVAGDVRHLPGRPRPAPAPLYPPNQPTQHPYEALMMTPAPSIPGLSAYMAPADNLSLVFARRRSSSLTVWLIVYTLGGLLMAAAIGVGALRFMTLRPAMTEETVLFVLLWGGAVLAAMGYAVAIMAAWGWRKWAVQVLMFLSFFLFPVGPLLALVWWLVMRAHWDMFR